MGNENTNNEMLNENIEENKSTNNPFACDNGDCECEQSSTEACDVDNAEVLQVVEEHIANKNNPHGVTAAQIGAATVEYVDEALATIPTPDVSGQITTHNESETAHADIRELIDDISIKEFITVEDIDTICGATTNVQVVTAD